MKFSILFAFLFISSLGDTDKIRTIEYDGQEVKTTYSIPDKFFGKYVGAKTGYLELKQDGTGIYTYDVFGFAPSACKKESIHIEWGFLLDDKDSIVSFSREYGRSYPMLMESTGSTTFQGCRKRVMLDFIMEYKNGKIGVSSSDDWMK